MLSSTADHLYWMARSMERAENTARALDVTYSMSMVSQEIIDPYQNWSAVLSISGLQELFSGRHSELNADNILHFMVLDQSNPASIISSLRTARENAHAVRGTITSEMWEAINHTWLDMCTVKSQGIPEDGVSSFFAWVKDRSHLTRGITHGTLMRDDAFRFLRLGTFLERADNTARILDVKYHVLMPSPQDVGGAADFYHWSAILRSVSALETFRKVYRDAITPKRVANLLILRPDMPRSLHFCMAEVNRLLQEISGRTPWSLHRQIGRMHSELRYGQIEDIIAFGLHEYLTIFLERIYELGDQINMTYFWPMDT